MTAPLILGTNSIKDTGYNVNNSLRFNDGDSPVLSKTASGSGNRRTWTISWWFKRSTLGEMTFFWQDGASTDHETKIAFDSSNRLFIYDFDGASFNMLLKTNRNFRDISAWYHAVIAVDTTDGTAANRIKMYINGVQETSFETATYPSQNHNTEWNTNNELRIAKDSTGSHFDGYLTEIVNVDGTQLAQTLFGEFDEDSPNIWKPIVLDLTFGTNGFYLEFSDSSALGDDTSGNNNDWTVANLAATDQSTDTCTNNFATINRLNFGSGTLSEGNLKWTASAASGNLAFGTIAIDMSNSDKFYWETKIDSIGSGIVIGLAPLELRWNDTGRSGFYGYYSDGNKYVGTSASSYGASFTTNDIIGILAGNGTLTFYKNGSSQGDAFTGLTGYYLPSFAEVGMTASFNFGSPPYSVSSGNSDPEGYGNFEYSTNSGYALNTKNLAEYG